jgi:hypothetical protein
MHAFRRREQNRSSRPIVDGLFLAVRTLNLMSVQAKLNHIKFWPGVLYYSNAMELIGSHDYRALSHPQPPDYRDAKKLSVRWRTYFELPLSSRHSSSCDRIIW